MARKKKPHPADIYTAAQIARAASFVVYFRKGPHEVYRETALSLEQAREIEIRMNADHGAFGRRAIVYAITPEGVNHIVPTISPKDASR
jgi:hypothetical protein